VKEYIARIQSRIASIYQTFIPKVEVIKAEFDRLNEPDSILRVGDFRNSASENYWLTVASDFGFVLPHMLRTRILHQYLWTTAFSRYQELQRESIPSRASKEEDPWMIPVASLYRQMPLMIYLKVIGHCWRSPKLDQYVRNKENILLPLCKLPLDVFREIFTDLKRFRRTLKNIIETMLFLGLLAPTDLNPKSFLFVVEYRLQHLAKLYDYTSAESPLLSEHDFFVESGPSLYWTQLQLTCLSSQSKNGLHARENTNRDLTNSRNWNQPFYFGLEKRVYLRSFINESTCETPYTDEKQLGEIADQLHVEVKRVRDFYRQYLLARGHSIAKEEHNESSQEEESFENTLSSSLIASSKGNLKSIRENGRIVSARRSNSQTPYRSVAIERPMVHCTFSKVTSTMDTDNKRKVDESEASEYENGVLHQKRRRHAPWTKQEDDVLVAAHIAIAFHTKAHGNLWKYVKLPGRRPQECRRRYGCLKGTNPQIEVMHMDWSDTREKLIQAGELKPANCYPTDSTFQHEIHLCLKWLHFSISAPSVAQTSRYIGFIPVRILCFRSNGIKSETSTISLNPPLGEMEMEEVIRKYDIIDIFDPEERGTIPPQSDVPLSVKSTMDLKHGCGYRYICKAGVTTSDKDVSREIIMSTLKSIVTLPLEDFDRQEAIQIVSTFDTEAIEQCINQAKSAGTIAESRTIDRRLPGRSLALSRNATRLLDGPFSKRFTFIAKNSYEHYMMETSQNLFDKANLDDSDMVALLALLVDEKVVIEPEFGVVKLKDNLRAKSLDDPELFLSMSTVRPRTNQDECLVSGDEIEVERLKERVRSAVQDRHENGLSIEEWRDLFGNERKDCLEKSLRELLQCKEVFAVGSHQLRLVDKDYEFLWTRPAIQINEEEMVCHLLKPGDANYTGGVPPRLWHTLHGTFSRSIFEQVAQSIWWMIFSHPGANQVR